MSNETRGTLPSIDPLKCTGCLECVAACPRGAIFEPLNVCCAKCVKYCMTFEVNCRREKPAVAVDRCDSCGRCIDVCAAGAIGWTRRLDQDERSTTG